MVFSSIAAVRLRDISAAPPSIYKVYISNWTSELNEQDYASTLTHVLIIKIYEIA